MKQRILIFSTCVVETAVVETALAGLDVEVRVAVDAPAFRRLTERLIFDLVIVVGVGYLLSGDAFFRRVRPRPMRRPEIYLITHQQSEQTVMGLLECGVDQYMTFPLNLARLRAKVIGALERA
ncbi:MAG: DNA-binding response regulator [Alistipes sp.]|nr:DNA-binding response regulator [Alistipes sp.]